MTPFLFVICCLVSARVTRFLVIDSGPSNVMVSIRRWLGAQGGSDQPGSLAKAFDCPYCMAFWVSLGVVGLASADDPLTWLLHSLAASFVSGALVVWSNPYEM